MAQDVGRQVADVVAQRMAPAAQQRESARRLDHPDRAAWARPVLDELAQVAQAVALGVARAVDELDRIRDDLAVDEDVRRRALEAHELGHRHAHLDVLRRGQ